MPKPDQNYKFILIVITAVSLVVFYYLYKDKGFKQSLIFSSSPSEINYLKGIDYLNAVRTDLGLPIFIQNQNLNISAKNHVKYLTQNKTNQDIIAHIEDELLPGFTGKDQSQRAVFAGYPSTYVFENISHNQININSSIDSLLSAIYHRFGFLSYKTDEIGFFQDNGVYVYNMGNSALNFLCKSGGNFDSKGYYVAGVCSDKNLKIKQQSFKNATMPSEPKYIIYPYNVPSLAYFGNEIPDPLPECKITANPVSVEFNPNIKNIKMSSFKIFDGNKEITDTVLMDKNNDINSKFEQNQFALFSKNVFEFAKEYRAEFKYSIDSKPQEINWNFKTQTPEFSYFVVSGGENLAVEADKIYDIFVKPKDCNDIFLNYSYSFSSFLKAKLEYVGLNTIRVFASGFKGDKIDVKLDNGLKFSILLTTTSKDAFSIFGFKHIDFILLLSFFIIVLIFLLNLRHKI